MKVRKGVKNIFKLLLMVGFICTMGIVQANGPNIKPNHIVKDGYVIYLGLLPAEMIEGHTSHSMHGGIPSGQYRYHLAIAIFDDETGKRIKNAKVQVSISNRIGIGMESNKALEDMDMNGKFMYGNYFKLKTAGPYRIDVIIDLGSNRKPLKVVFNYDFAHT